MTEEPGAIYYFQSKSGKNEGVLYCRVGARWRNVR